MIVGEPSSRLFFAALPDPATRGRIASQVTGLPLGTEGRAVTPESYHVTLAFVGQVPVSRLPTLLDIGAGLRSARFGMRFEAYEYWPKPEVIVAAVRGIPPALDVLWKRLHEALAAHQWALDAKRLRPHVTLARKVSQPPVLQAMSPVEWSAGEFSLMSSDTSGLHSAYTVVDTWPLLDESAES